MPAPHGAIGHATDLWDGESLGFAGRLCRPASGANMCSMPVVCVLLPRFELVVAVGAREALLKGPAALAPESGREQLVGEVSAAAEGFGIHPGMRMGEALARCPRLALVPPESRPLWKCCTPTLWCMTICLASTMRRRGAAFLACTALMASRWRCSPAMR